MYSLIYRFSRLYFVYRVVFLRGFIYSFYKNSLILDSNWLWTAHFNVFWSVQFLLKQISVILVIYNLVNYERIFTTYKIPSGMIKNNQLSKKKLTIFYWTVPWISLLLNFYWLYLQLIHFRKLMDNNTLLVITSKIPFPQ